MQQDKHRRPLGSLLDQFFATTETDHARPANEMIELVSLSDRRRALAFKNCLRLVALLARLYRPACGSFRACESGKEW